jgi:hypothetical protein
MPPFPIPLDQMPRHVAAARKAVASPEFMEPEHIAAAWTILRLDRALRRHCAASLEQHDSNPEPPMAA